MQNGMVYHLSGKKPPKLEKKPQHLYKACIGRLTLQFAPGWLMQAWLAIMRASVLGRG